jgi:hypothetical protein
VVIERVTVSGVRLASRYSTARASRVGEVGQCGEVATLCVSTPSTPLTRGRRVDSLLSPSRWATVHLDGGDRRDKDDDDKNDKDEKDRDRND